MKAHRIASVLLVSLLLPFAVRATESAAPAGVVNVNTATAAQLGLLARTGPKLAEKIIAARPIKDLAALDAVKGIGEKWLAVNGPHCSFSGNTTLTEKLKAPKAEEK